MGDLERKAASVAVTGASGFLGGHVAGAFEARGDAVARIGRESLSAFLEARERHDVIVHAAAVRHRHGIDAATYRASNVDLIEQIIRARVGRFGRLVLVSSVGVYGFPRELPVTEAFPYAPRTLYSATKVHAEERVRRLARELGFEFTIVRPTIIYGKGDRNGMLDKLAAMLSAHRYLLVGRGDNVLHHTHVDDVVAGILLASERPAAAGEHFILAGPETTTLAELSRLVAARVGAKVPRIHVPLALARAVATVIDVAAYRGLAFADAEPPINHEKLDVMTRSIAFDPAKARRLLGFEPRVGYVEGLARTLGPS